jgi:hypothetical protein
MSETTVDFADDEDLYEYLQEVAAGRSQSVADLLLDAACTVHVEDDDLSVSGNDGPTVVDVEPTGREGERRDTDAEPVDERSPPATDDHAPVRGETSGAGGEDDDPKESDGPASEGTDR